MGTGQIVAIVLVLAFVIFVIYRSVTGPQEEEEEGDANDKT